MNLLGTVAKALGNTRKIQMMASLDHSMWFYETFDMNKPLLFFMQTQVSSHGRGLAMGRFYSQEGTLLAVVVSMMLQITKRKDVDHVSLTLDSLFHFLLHNPQSQEGLVRSGDARPPKAEKAASKL
jgi:hypothetical protein